MFPPHLEPSRRVRRTGLTLVELLAVSTILLMMGGAMAALAMSVQDGNRIQYGQGLSLQHGQVTLWRIQRAVQNATASDDFPGLAVFAQTVGANSFPDTLVVWQPVGPAIDSTGLPRIAELVVFCPNPAKPNELLEITKRFDSRTAPPLSNFVAWQTELADFKSNVNAARIVMTDLVRIGAVSGTSPLIQRGALRFESRVRPSEKEWSEYLAGRIAWNALPWAQGIFGPEFGLRQSLCRVEIQLRPGDTTDNRRDLAIPFFGSAALYYNLSRATP